MILLFIITSILYLILTYLVLSLYYRYRKDVEEIENRMLILEKRITKLDIANRTFVFTNGKESEVSDMACKKGRGGRKK